MISDTLRNLSKRYQSVLTMVWVALTLSILLYVGIVYYIFASAGELGPGPSHETLEFVFRFVAVSLGIASILWRRFHLSDERLTANLAREVSARSLATNRQTGQVHEDRLSQIESLSAFEQKLLSLASRYHVPYIVSLVLNEAIAIVGFVLAFLTANPGKMVPFALASIILNVLTLPRLNTLLNRASLLGPPEMPAGPTTQFDRSIDGDRAMDSKSRLSPGAILVLAGGVVYVIGRFFIEGNKGLAIGAIGFCVIACGFIMHRLKPRGK